MSCIIERLEGRRLLAVTYYVSATGNDVADGLSPATAWQSIDRANQVDLNGGDKVLFEGGKTFSTTGTIGPNLIINPGFELGETGWTDPLGSNAANGSVVPDSVNSGAGTLRLRGSGAATRAQDVTASVLPNQTYMMSASTRGTNLGSGIRRVGASFYLAGKHVGTFYRGFRSPVWSTQTWEF